MVAKTRNYNELDQIRRELGMSCSTVAQRAGLSLPTVQRVMAGQYQSASLATLQAIARALGGDVTLAVPSIEDVRERQAWSKAEKLVAMAQATAGLESQGVDEDKRRDAVRRVAASLLSGSPRKLWSE